MQQPSLFAFEGAAPHVGEWPQVRARDVRKVQPAVKTGSTFLLPRERRPVYFASPEARARLRILTRGRFR